MKKIIIIGAGAAGIGMGIVLKKMGIDFLILEKDIVGKSFLSWPKGTQFLSPSFSGNFFGSPDLNSVCPETSPAYTLQTEHPSGEEYAYYLKALSNAFDLPITENTKVESIEKQDKGFKIKTNKDDFQADFVIWAGGEYQFPKTKVCNGSEHGIHNTHIEDYEKLEGDIFPIIGGYESGFDTAVHLARIGKKSVIFDSQDHLSLHRTDASVSLSPFTKDRYKKYQEFISVKPFTKITDIQKNGAEYFLISDSEEQFHFKTQPILATGFETSLSLVKDLFEWKNNSVLLTDSDESTITPGFFLSGPQVKHNEAVFCFIYKFRQRFPIIAEQIAQSLGMENDEKVQQTIKEYQDANFYLKDLSCCDGECIC